MADIFISYARDDRPTIETLAGALEADGYSVWWDRHIAGGSEFSKDIERELNAANVVIVAWSATSAESTWVKDEAGIASKDGKLVAISLDSTEPPLGFKQFHAIGYGPSDANSIGEIKRSIRLRMDGTSPAAGPSSQTAPAKPTPEATPSGSRKIMIAGIASAVLLAFVAAFFLLRGGGAGETEVASGAPRDDYTSIAVLAFEDLSPAGDQDYFSSGIAEELLNVLARETDMRVAARTSSFAFKGSNQSIADIGKALNVEAVLEGSVRKSGDTIRITAQLIDARSGYHLWSETYDRELADVFSLQDEISQAIVASLPGVEITRSANVPVTDEETYELILRARHLLAQRGKEPLQEALGLFREATARDPDYAPAWADLALSALQLIDSFGTYGDLTVDEGAAIAEPAIEKALALSPNLAEAYRARGLLRYREGDLDAALVAIQTALKFNPTLSDARHFLYLIYLKQQDFKAAEQAIDKAIESDPLSLIIRVNYTDSLIDRGRFDDALASAELLMDQFPENQLARSYSVRAKMSVGKLAEAIADIDRYIEADGDASVVMAGLASAPVSLKIESHPVYDSNPLIKYAYVPALFGKGDQVEQAVPLILSQINQQVFANAASAYVLNLAGKTQAADELIAASEAMQSVDPDQAEFGCFAIQIMADYWRRNGAEEKVKDALAPCLERAARVYAAGYNNDTDSYDSYAALLALNGENDAALAVLERLVDHPGFTKWFIDRDPAYRELRGDPAFQAVVDKLNARVDAQRALYDTLAGGAD